MAVGHAAPGPVLTASCRSAAAVSDSVVEATKPDERMSSSATGRIVVPPLLHAARDGSGT